jgi:hypothetical protein
LAGAGVEVATWVLVAVGSNTGVNRLPVGKNLGKVGDGVGLGGSGVGGAKAGIRRPGKINNINKPIQTSTTRPVKTLKVSAWARVIFLPPLTADFTL